MNRSRRERVIRRLHRLRRRLRACKSLRMRHTTTVARWVSDVAGEDIATLSDAKLVRLLHSRVDELLALDGTIVEPLTDLGAYGLLWAGVTLARGRVSLLERRIALLERQLHEG